MSKTIFIILENSSDHDDVPEAIGYSKTLEDAKAICEKLDQFYLVLKGFYDVMTEELRPLREKDLHLETMNPLPKWASGLAATEITTEQRAERDKILGENTARKKRNWEKTENHKEEIIKRVAEYLDCEDSVGEDLHKYFKKMITSTGSMEKFLFPYDIREVKKLKL